LIHEQVSIWKKAFEEKHSDINLVHLDGIKTEVGEMMTQLEAAPFLGDKRLIFIENLPEAPQKRVKKDDGDKKKKPDKYEKLGDYLERIPETSVVVFVQSNPDKRKSLYKKFVQSAEVKEFKSLNGYALNKWIQNRCRKHQINIDQSAIQHLIDLAGGGLWRIDQELQKLAAYTEKAQ